MLLAAVAVCLLCSASCSKPSSSSAADATQKKILVAYFSCTNTTRDVAERLAVVAGADLYQIEPEVPYPDADLDWTNESSRSSVEMKNPMSRPAIKQTLQNADSYDMVFIGFPIWWYTAPTLVNTFVETYRFEGKVVVPFCTSGGSNIEKAQQSLQASSPNAVWRNGKLLNHATEESLKPWFEQLIKE